MQQTVRTASPPTAPTDENLILADIERLLGEDAASGLNGALAVSPVGRRGRTVPLLLVAGVALAVALVPTGLRKVSSGIYVTHQAAND